MSIKNILKFNSWVSVIIIALSLVFLVLSVQKKNKADEDNDIAEQIHTLILERTMLRDEYLLHREKHLWLRWESKTEEIRQILAVAEKRFINPSDSELLDQIKEEFESTVSLVRKVAETEEKINSDGEKRLLSRIFVKIYSMIEKINRIEHSAQTSASDAQQKMMVMMTIFIVISVMMSIGNSWVINRALGKGVEELLKGSAIIGSGDLDYRITIKGNNELSDLAAAVNDMAYNLKETHTSVENLHTEIVNRKIAEEKLKATLYSIGDAVITTDKNGMIMQMNFVAEHLTGWTEADAFGKSLDDIFHIINEETRNPVESPVNLVIQKGTTVGLANHTLLIAKDGIERPIADSGAPIKNDAGEITGVVLVFRDQTNERNTERTIAESLERLNLATHAANMGIWDWNIAANNLIWDDRMYELYGIPKEAFGNIYETWLNALHPEDREKSNELSQKVRSGEREYDTEFRIILPDGSIRFIKAYGVVISDAAGNPIRMTGVNFDITKEKQAEEALRESKAKMDAALASMTDAVFISDIDGRFIEFNEAFATFHKFKNKAECAKTLAEYPLFLDVFMDNGELLPFDMWAVPRALRGETVSNAEYSLRRKDTGESWVGSYSFAPIRDQEGNIVGSVVVGRDITERRQMEDALRSSEHRYRSLFENMLEGYAYCKMLYDDGEPDFVYLDVNHAFSKLTGLNNVVGKKVTQVIPDIRQSDLELLEIYSRVAQTGQAERFEIYVKSLKIWFSVSVYSPEKEYFVAIFNNITERKNKDAELRISLEKYRVLFESFPLGITITDNEGRILEGNQKSVELLGISKEEHIRRLADGEEWHIVRPDRSLMPPDEYASVRALRGNCIVENVEMGIVKGQGRITWLSVTAAPIPLEGYGVAVTYIDISQKKEAEFALNKLTAELEQRVAERTAEVQDLYNNAPCGYHSLDKNGVFLHINDTELNWLGYTRDEIIGKKPVTDIFTEKSRLIFKQNFPVFKERGWVKDLEFELIRKDGSVFPVLLNGTAIKDSEGNYLSSRSTLFDITERKKAEEEIARKSEELILANIALEKASRLKDEFLAGMSHELRTPLTGVISLSEALSEEVYGPLNEKQQKALRTVGESGQHLLELINDVLDLSKVEAGQLTLQAEKCSVSDICNGSLQLIKGMANKKKHKVVFDMNPSSLSVDADPRRLKQIIVNLLSNAVKFTPEGGQIGLHVEGDLTNQNISFIVSDTGIGIEPDDLPKLFMPFVQLDSSLSRQYSGTGLGLSLVRTMTELHGGKVRLESAVGKGSRFTVTLPWIAPAQILPDTSDADVGQLHVKEQSVKSLVLLIEDNEINIETYSDYLQIKGHNVLVARDGVEGIKKAQEAKPDIILMDIQMPGMDGWEAIRHIRADADPEVASVPIIALTALAMPGDREKCIAAGAKDYLSKPVKLKHLLETIEKYLNRN